MNIDKRVPIPKNLGPYHKGTKSLLLKMCIGDSIFVETQKDVFSLRALSGLVASESGRKHMSRKVEGGWRLWRVE